MTTNSMTLMERQVVNIADGKCLGNLKDIELNLWTGSIEALRLPA
jgi:sporulation protein YlmC with PRC-barrel domain